MNRILADDIKRLAEDFALTEHLQKSTFLITGATGLIGSTLIHCLLALEQHVKVVAPVRNAAARGMAEYLRDNFNPNISVRVEPNDNMGYAPATKLKLTSAKLADLGWMPKYGLKEIFQRLIAYLNED